MRRDNIRLNKSTINSIHLRKFLGLASIIPEEIATKTLDGFGYQFIAHFYSSTGYNQEPFFQRRQPLA